jgi:hypothetical protein
MMKCKIAFSYRQLQFAASVVFRLLKLDSLTKMRLIWNGIFLVILHLNHNDMDPFEVRMHFIEHLRRLNA